MGDFFFEPIQTPPPTGMNWFEAVVKCLFINPKVSSFYEGLSVDQISKWTGIDPELVNEGIRRWREFLDEETKTSPKLFRIYHASFQDFLKDQVSLKKYHAIIARALMDIWKEQKKTLRSASLQE